MAFAIPLGLPEVPLTKRPFESRDMQGVYHIPGPGQAFTRNKPHPSRRYTGMGRTVRPLKNKLLVKQDPGQDKVGSLFISKTLHEDFGTVIAVGSDVKVDVKVGDRVLFQRQASSHIGEELPEFENLLMLKEDNILAVIEP